MTAARIVTSSTDTQPTIVPPNSRQWWWSIPLVVASFVVLLAVLVAGILPASTVADKDVATPDGAAQSESTPYTIVPGSAQPVGSRIKFENLPADVPVFPSANDIYFVTISEPTQSLLSWVIGGDEPVIHWLTEFEKYGSQTPSQRREQSLQMMATSEDVAKFVALKAAGYDPKIVPLGLEVDSLVCPVAPVDDKCPQPAPSAKLLVPGDVILKANGKDVMSTTDLSTALKDTKPGDTVSITVRRGEKDVTGDIELVADPDDPTRAIVGFVPFEPFDIELPFDVDIDTGSIGGPSAGAAFTVTLLDELTKGDLLHGDVAMTGTIALDGTIGAIGGLPQKAEAVRQTGVDLFLVPKTQTDEEIAAARQIAGDSLDIVPVGNLDEALTALAEHGGDPLVLAD